MILDSQPQSDSPIADDGYLPARMINEAVYCPRLFYLMYVEGLFLNNRDTTNGSIVHRRVDQRVDALPQRIQAPEIDPAPGSTECDALFDDEQDENCRGGAGAKPSPRNARRQLGLFSDEGLPAPDAKREKTKRASSSKNIRPAVPDDVPVAIPVAETIHARSVTLASDELGVIAKLDLIEGEGTVVTPVDYKQGRPRQNFEGTIGAWPPERVQICLQALTLRENGYTCDQGVLYFVATKQRVVIDIDEALIEMTRRAVADAREISHFKQPPLPLVDSPKCPRCSLSPICLPDETNACIARDRRLSAPQQLRLPLTPRDDLKPLYLNTQGMAVGRKSEVLQIKENGKVVDEVRLRELNQVNILGNIQVSTQALQSLCEMQVPVVFMSSRGYFHGMLQGTGLKNIGLRREQFRTADLPQRCLEIARSLVAGKIRNQRTLLMRNHIQPPKPVLHQIKKCVAQAEHADALETLLGIEGNAARIYFANFDGMLKPGDTPLDPANALGSPPTFAFDFRTRSRRPPRDPVNALLSFGYSLLAKDLTVACAAVGLDPHLGFYHQPRPGRPSLSLDLMEPFRALIVDSVVLSAINTRMVYPESFITAGNGVTLTAPGRKGFLRAYESRMDQLVTHPLFKYRVSYRRLLEIQTRLLAKWIIGEIASYPVFVTR